MERTEGRYGPEPVTAAQPERNFADVWEAVARRIPDAPAQMQGARTISWAEFDRRANGVAAAFLLAVGQHQQRLGSAQLQDSQNPVRKRVLAQKT